MHTIHVSLSGEHATTVGHEIVQIISQIIILVALLSSPPHGIQVDRRYGEEIDAPFWSLALAGVRRDSLHNWRIWSRICRGGEDVSEWHSFGFEARWL